MITKISSFKGSNLTNNFNYSNKSVNISFTGINATKLGEKVIEDSGTEFGQKTERFFEGISNLIKTGFKNVSKRMKGNDEIPYTEKPYILADDKGSVDIDIDTQNKTHPGDVLIEKPENDDPSKVDWARYWLEQRQKEEADIAKKKAEEEANKKAEEAAKKAEEAKKSPSFSGDDAINDFDNINMTQNTLGDLSNINSFMDKANLPESFKNAVDHSINSTKSDFTQAKNLVEEKKDYYDGKFKEIKEKIEKEEHPISGESDEIDNAKAEMPQNNQIVEDAPQDIDVINNDEPMRQEEAEDPQDSSIDFPISEPSPYIPETPSPFDETPNDDSGFLDI